jgi:hypothetical protein
MPTLWLINQFISVVREPQRPVKLAQHYEFPSQPDWGPTAKSKRPEHHSKQFARTHFADQSYATVEYLPQLARTTADERRE